MATAYTAAAANRPAISSSEAGEHIAQTGVFDLSAAFVINDTVDMCKLPAGMVVDDLILSTDDLDSGGSPAIVVDVGLYDNVGSTSSQAAFISGSNVAQAGGVARLAVAAGRKIAPVDYDRYIRVKVTTAPATGATSGKIKVTAITRNKGFDD
jgi:hypothetical protein